MSNDAENAIDAAIFACAENNWKKTALIVSRVMEQIGKAEDSVVDEIIARLCELERRGALEINGDVSLIRNSEIRLTSSPAEG